MANIQHDDKGIQGESNRQTLKIGSAKFLAQELKEKYNLHQEIYVHKHVNSYKYSAGMFSSYHDANQYCNYLKKEKEIRAFIIAFKDNERISIHEARIVTKEN
ncbi:MAG: hypothetical protein C0594_17625 [Marinilabiliales bacterium]|nr:MAG: hypothetical protein C0594_17625 [Marinilabiliales bacterium]